MVEFFELQNIMTKIIRGKIILFHTTLSNIVYIIRTSKYILPKYIQNI